MLERALVNQKAFERLEEEEGFHLSLREDEPGEIGDGEILE